jgi:tetratricopeptide (TPR) repeat protein
MADSQMALGKVTDALETYKRLLEYFKDSPLDTRGAYLELYYKIGSIYYTLCEYDMSREWLLKTKSIPDNINSDIDIYPEYKKEAENLLKTIKNTGKS